MSSSASASAGGSVDLRPIGINAIADASFAFRFNQSGFLMTTIDTSNVKYSHTMKGTNVSSVTFTPNQDVSGQESYITVTVGKGDTATYTLGRVLGKGTYGTVYELFDEHFAITKVRYVLKDQIIENSQDIVDYYREGIVHAVLAANSDSVGKIYAIGSSSIQVTSSSTYKSVMMIMEIAGNTTVKDYMRGLSKADSKQGVPAMVSTIANILEPLQKTYYFTHGDFKSDNCMIDTATQKIKLIDFGFARIARPVSMAVQPYFNKTFEKGRDLTTLVFNILNYITTNSVLEDRIVLEDMPGADVTECDLNTIDVDDDSSITCNGHTITTDDILGTLYQYFNRFDNIRCWPDTLQKHIAAAAPPAAPSAAPSAAALPLIPSSPSSMHVSPRRGGKRNRKTVRGKKQRGKKRGTKKRMRGGKVALLQTPVSLTPSLQKLKPNVKANSTQPDMPRYIEDELEGIRPRTVEALLPVYQERIASATITDELRTHVTTHAHLILETYITEQNTSISKDLLQTLLFFKEYPVGNGAFEEWIRYYTASSPSKRIALVANKVHWTAESL